MSYLKNLLNLKELAESAEKKVCAKYKITREDIATKKRTLKNSQARFAVWYILNKVHGLSSPVIGELYKADHTSVLYGIRRAQILNIPAELGYENCGHPVEELGISTGKPVNSKEIKKLLT